MPDALRAETNRIIDAAERRSDPIVIRFLEAVTPAEWDNIARRAQQMWHDYTCPCNHDSQEKEAQP